MKRATTRNRGRVERSRSAERRTHWERIYRTRSEGELSWHQAEPTISVQLIKTFAGRSSRILDAGGGSSRLAQRLSADGFQNLTVVDVSKHALERGRARSGKAAQAVRRVRADLLGGRQFGTFDVWHDRAVFHFLTRGRDRAAYLRLLRRSLAPGGIVVVASFAPDGPEKCSGLPVARYSPASLALVFGDGFRLIRARREIHRTPWGTHQPFSYAVLRYSPSTSPPPGPREG